MNRRVFLILLGVTGTAFAERAARPACKGYELYSWRINGDFRYALVPGTNRNKTWDEIHAAGIERKALEARLRKLAVGENVFWFHPKAMPLEYPPDVAAVRALCEGLQIQLTLP